MNNIAEKKNDVSILHVLKRDIKDEREKISANCLWESFSNKIFEADAKLDPPRPSFSLKKITIMAFLHY